MDYKWTLRFRMLKIKIAPTDLVEHLHKQKYLLYWFSELLCSSMQVRHFKKRNLNIFPEHKANLDKPGSTSQKSQFWKSLHK